MDHKSKVFKCDCYGHGFSLEKWTKGYDPNVWTGLDIDTETIFDDDYANISFEFWYDVYGEGYYGNFWNRLKGAWRLLRGRRYTFDAFEFRPYQIKEIADYLNEEYDRITVEYRDDGVKKDIEKRIANARRK